MNVTMRAKSDIFDGGMVAQRIGAGAAAAAIPGLSYDMSQKIAAKTDKAGRVIVQSSVLAGALLAAKGAALAAVTNPQTLDIAKKFDPLIQILQDFAFPVGIGVATWGFIEIMMGNPRGKMKVKYSIIGYVGIFVLPFVFEIIRGAFRG